MTREAVEQLIDRWMNDPDFREQVRVDPLGAVQRSGAQLDADELAALRDFDWSASDEQLEARISPSRA